MRQLASVVLLALLSGFIPQTSLSAESAKPIMSLPSDAVPITDIYDQIVYNSQEAEVGKVNDILLDQDGNVVAVILGVGGLLGMAEKNIAVPFSAIKVGQKDSGERYLVINMPNEGLEKAPGFIHDSTKGVWIPAE
jgi:sporulation protein YlmC with PRC-barrel domain